MTADVVHPAARSERVRVLDLLRFVAALQMVQGHTIDAVLAPAFREGAVHQAWLWLRGLTSVAFLFAAGLSFSLATLRDASPVRTARRGVARRVRRAGILVLLGYALHLPLSLLFASAAPADGETLGQALVVDVLQCIGVSLLTLEALAYLLPSVRALEATCFAIGSALLLCSPLTARVGASGAWLPLLDYVTPRGGSLFPLLPWAGHVFLGAASARFLLRSRAPTFGGTAPALRGGASVRLACAALVLIACAAWLPSAAPLPNQLSRLGWVLAAMALLALFEPAMRSLPGWVWVVSGETLFVYAFHVLLVYGQAVGLSARVGPVLSPGPAALLALGVIAVSFAGALAYRRAAAGLAGSTATG